MLKIHGAIGVKSVVVIGHMFVVEDENVVRSVADVEAICRDVYCNEYAAKVIKGDIDANADMVGDNEQWDLAATLPNFVHRKAVAMQGKSLDILLNDINPNVRATVATQNHRLDLLVNDPSEIVRVAVARQRYDLDVLANDPCDLVREVVAEHFYYLTSPAILVFDTAQSVRKIVLRKSVMQR